MSDRPRARPFLRFMCLIAAMANLGGNVFILLFYRPVFAWLNVPLPQDIFSFTFVWERLEGAQQGQGRARGERLRRRREARGLERELVPLPVLVWRLPAHHVSGDFAPPDDD
jgi:hypothetical protein